MIDHNRRPRLLILAGKTVNREEIVRRLSEVLQIDVVQNADDAQHMLRTEEFNAVLADVGDFLPLERALVDQLSSVVLNTIGEGVCVIDPKGQCVWANHRMRSFPSEIYDRVKQACASARALFTNQVSPPSNPGYPDRGKVHNKKFGFALADDRYFEAFVSPIHDHQGNIRHLVAVVWDASSGRRLTQKINAIDSAGRELVRLESEALASMNVGQRLKLLEDKIIRYTRDLMRFDHFCIRLINKKNNKLELVMSVGLPPEALDVDLYAEPEGNGISGYVAATGRSYICHDVEKDPRYVIGLDKARSALTVPLRLHDKVLGVFNIESRQRGAFNEDDRQFAEIFGRYIGLALNILDLLVVERYTVTGRLAGNITGEIAAPLNDICSEAQSLIEDYIGNDDMRDRLSKIVDYVNSIRQTVKHVSEGHTMVIGMDTAKTGGDSRLAGKRVLVADDETNIRDCVSAVLTKVGCEVFVCKDGHEAVNLIEQQPLDLIVSDIRMPHRTGYEIYAAAKRKNEELPVILMTAFGYDPHHSVVRASQEGLSAVLYKPFKVEKLMQEVYEALKVPPPDAS